MSEVEFSAHVGSLDSRTLNPMPSLLSFCALHQDNPIEASGPGWVQLSGLVTLPTGETVRELSPRLYTVADARRWLGY